MTTIHQQLTKERNMHYDNGLYHCFQAYYLSGLRSIVDIPCDDLQIDLLISDEVFYNPNHIPVPTKQLLLLFVNTFIPDWILDSYEEDITEEYLLDLHKRISSLPLRDGLKPNRWPGRYKSNDVKDASQDLFEVSRSDFYEWASMFIPLYFKISPFYNLNKLVLYTLILKETLYHNLFFPLLQKADFMEIQNGECNIKEFFRTRIEQEKKEFEGFMFD